MDTDDNVGVTTSSWSEVDPDVNRDYGRSGL